MINVILLNHSRISSIPTKKYFERWVNQTINAIPRKKIPKKATEICIAIINKKNSATLNQQFRGKKGPTNILSFPYDLLDDKHGSLGDLAICASIVKTEAKAQKKLFNHHWAHLTIHGVLHLLGYDHIADKDAVMMEKLEINILKRLGIKNPYV